MGNASAHAMVAGTQLQVDPRERLQEDLPKLIYLERLSNGKFMKSYRYKVDGVGIVVKVYVRRDPEEDLRPAEAALMRIARSLPPDTHPNVLPYQRWHLSKRSTAAVNAKAGQPVYLVRQHILANLYDRLSTRPFLATVEKRWIAYQLLRAVAQCHQSGVCHGDLISENVLVTSWNWILLADFAPFKPTFLPEDQPAIVEYYFNSRERRRCYLAPERFYAVQHQHHNDDTMADSRLHSSDGMDASVSGSTYGASDQSSGITTSNSSGNLTRGHETSTSISSTANPARGSDGERLKIGTLQPSMDVFSLGCIIAEVFLDGEAALDLPELLQYRTTSDTSTCLKRLSKVEDSAVQQLVRHMLQVDPSRRRSAAEYLERMEKDEVLFPRYFGKFLFGLMEKMHTTVRMPDDRLHLICSCYEEAMLQLAGIKDPEGGEFFRSIIATGTSPGTAELSSVTAQTTTAETSTSTPGTGTPTSTSTLKQKPSTRGPLVATNSFNNNNRSSGTAGASGDNNKWGKGLMDLLESTRTLIESLESSEKKVPGTSDVPSSSPVTTSTGGPQEGPGSRRKSSSSTSVKEDGSTALRKRSYSSVSSGAHPGAQSYTSDPVPPAYQGPSQTHDIHTSSTSPASGADVCIFDDGGSGLVILAQVVCSCLGHLRWSKSKLLALCLIARFGKHCGDEARLQRLVPYVTSLLEDPVASVRATAVRVLTYLIGMVTSFPPSDSNVFALYLFPALQHIPHDNSSELVRAAFAECLPLLAETSRRFLDIANAMKLIKVTSAQSVPGAQSNPPGSGTQSPTTPTTAQGRKGEGPNNDTEKKLQYTPGTGGTGGGMGMAPGCGMISVWYDKELAELRRQVGRWFVQLASSPSPQAVSMGIEPPPSQTKLCLVGGAARLCAFFGQDSTLGSVLPQLITFLNDRHWALRDAFCRQIPAVCTFVGKVATSKFTLPCIENAMADLEDMVVASALRCLKSLAQLQLLSVTALVNQLEATTPMLQRPSLAVREAALEMFAAAAEILSPLDCIVFLLPLLQPYLSHSLLGAEITLPVLRSAIMAPATLKISNLQVSNLQIIPVNREQSGGKVPQGERGEPVSLESPGSSMPPSPTVPLSPLQRTVYAAAARRASAREAVQHHRQSTGGPSFGMETHPFNPTAVVLRHGRQLPQRLAQALYVPQQRNASVSADILRLQQSSASGSQSKEDSAENAPVPGTFWEDAESMALATGVQVSLKVLSSAVAKVDDATLAPPGVLGSSTAGEGQLGRQGGGLESKVLLSRAKALDVPPLPPNLGRASLIPTTTAADNVVVKGQTQNTGLGRGQRGSEWRPKQGALVASLREHKGAVNRLAVAQDSSFFASASSDGTCKVWSLAALESSTHTHSSLSYEGHTDAILDACIIDGTHSVATASADGSLQVWRVDLVPSISIPGGGSQQPVGSSRYTSLTSIPKLQSSALIRKIDANEGAVVSVNQFSGDLSSSIVYATQLGHIHAVDLRCRKEPWNFAVSSELGAITAVSIGHDKNWLCAATSRGFLSLWDLRFPMLAKLWRHSAHTTIHRISTCGRLPGDSERGSESSLAGPHVFLATGDNEASVFDLRRGGRAKNCFRVVPAGRGALEGSLPVLDEIQLTSHPRAPILGGNCQSFKDEAFKMQASAGERGGPGTWSSQQSCSSIRAMVGRISHSGTSFLITGGTDRHIRYWDFMVPSRCYVISGVGLSHPPPSVEYYHFPATSGSSVPPADDSLLTVFPVEHGPNELLQPALAPQADESGLVPPDGALVHSDAILDLKSAELPVKVLLSSSRDGVVNVWS